MRRWDLAGCVRRRWRVTLSCLLVTATITIIAAGALPRTYEARTQLLLATVQDSHGHIPRASGSEVGRAVAALVRAPEKQRARYRVKEVQRMDRDGFSSILLVTATGSSPASTRRTLGPAIPQLRDTLRRHQATRVAHGAPRLDLQMLARPIPLPDETRRITTLIALILALILASATTVALTDRRLLRHAGASST